MIKDNYDNWCIKLKAFIGPQNSIKIMEYGYHESEDYLQNIQKQVLKTNRKKDNKAMTIIYQGLDKATFEIISFVETSKEIWEALQQNTKKLIE